MERLNENLESSMESKSMSKKILCQNKKEQNCQQKKTKHNVLTPTSLHYQVNDKRVNKSK